MKTTSGRNGVTRLSRAGAALLLSPMQKKARIPRLESPELCSRTERPGPCGRPSSSHLLTLAVERGTAGLASGEASAQCEQWGDRPGTRKDFLAPASRVSSLPARHPDPLLRALNAQGRSETSACFPSCCGWYPCHLLLWSPPPLGPLICGHLLCDHLYLWSPHHGSPLSVVTSERHSSQPQPPGIGRYQRDDWPSAVSVPVAHTPPLISIPLVHAPTCRSGTVRNSAHQESPLSIHFCGLRSLGLCIPPTSMNATSLNQGAASCGDRGLRSFWLWCC